MCATAPWRWLEPYAADFGLRQAGRELQLQTTDRTSGRQVSKFQQTYQGIPVMAVRAGCERDRSGWIALDQW